MPACCECGDEGVLQRCNPCNALYAGKALLQGIPKEREENDDTLGKDLPAAIRQMTETVKATTKKNRIEKVCQSLLDLPDLEKKVRRQT